VCSYCGKDWSAEEISQIRELIASRPEANRADLSRMVCEALRWYRQNGKVKEMSCRVAMLRMQRDGLIELPAPTGHRPGKYKIIETVGGDPEPDLVCNIQELKDLKIHVVTRGPELRRWNEFVGRYHYLGYKMLPGAQIRYFIMNSGRVLGAMGFGASAWKIAPRDNFIGWTHEERKRGLHLIVGQSRFLILPWVQCRNLASKTLAMVTRRLAGDWEVRYGFRPVLLETFVDITRFHGTCYKAANWINVGNTQGRGKLDRFTKRNQPVKSIWLQPLAVDFRQRLRGMAVDQSFS
jgi:hypothetical protein